MTSDAKIGLLLGLVFIFIIAFVINGLPRFRSEKNNNELIVSSRDSKPSIGKIPREVIQQTKQVVESVGGEVQSAAGENENRLTMRLPKVPAVIPRSTESESGTSAKGEGGSGMKEEDKAERSRPSLPRIYVVKEDDNLAVIAQEFYGPEEGNRRVNIMRIFEANGNLLNSPDEIYAGQKLVIPPLPDSHKEKNAGNTFTGTMFEKVKSIGRRHPANGSAEEKQGVGYVVQEGDNLWRIAAERLGDGSRYAEIARLNAGILEDEDELAVGMHLKIPSR